MYIFLDDVRQPEDVTWVKLPKVEWTIVRNYDEFVKLLESLKQPPLMISFDHDLADEHYKNMKGTAKDFKEKTGLSCAKALVEIALDKKWKKVPPFKVHSMNPVGKKNIEDTLKSADRWF